jgi:FtsP/CotA-like multicopper oxidase with cupredoxin domain
MAVAERYSVVFTANQPPNNYWLRSAIDTNCFLGSNPLLNAGGVMAIVSYTNNSTDPSDAISVAWGGDDNVLCEDLNTTLLVPAVVQQAPKADLFYSLQFSFEILAEALDRAYINGTTWIPSEDLPTLNAIVPALKAGNATYNQTGPAPSYQGLSNQLIIDLPAYAVVDILLTNFDDFSHPFHLHGHTFWVMASSPNQYFDYSTYGSLNTTNPLRRDTAIVDSYGWILIRFINDNPGLWAFHCHITWHLEAGLMMQFQSRNDIMRDWTLPSDVLDLCNA